jgi:hypothetical protein
MSSKLGGALRAKKMLRAATHMTTARYETKPLMPFRVGRISDICTLHSDIFILPASGRSDNEFCIGLPDEEYCAESGKEVIEIASRPPSNYG